MGQEGKSAYCCFRSSTLPTRIVPCLVTGRSCEAGVLYHGEPWMTLKALIQLAADVHHLFMDFRRILGFTQQKLHVPTCHPKTTEKQRAHLPGTCSVGLPVVVMGCTTFPRSWEEFYINVEGRKVTNFST